MKKYSSYKDSGVEWMSKIPKGWIKSRIRMVGDLYGGLTGKKGDDFNNEENPSNKPFIPFTNIFNNTYISKDHFQLVNVEVGENQNRVQKFDLFFLMSSESYEDLGKSSILLEEVDELYLNSFCKGYRIKDKRVYPLFLNYQLLGKLHKEMISIEGNGFTRINLRQDRLLDVPVFIPPFSEQKKIVEFLDDKTQKIDNLIQQKEKKIELLKEKRTSLINHVVTKGLNPNVEMKDSDESWIEFFPNHWEHIHFGMICTLQQGLQIPFEERFFEKVEDSHEYITTQSIHRPEQPRQYIKSPKKSVLCSKDDIIYGRTGNTGEVVTGVEGVFHNNFFRIDYNKEKLDKNFLLWFLNNSRFKEHILLLSGTTTIPDLNHSSFFSNRILIPPKNEQQQIVDYLDEQTKEIDDLVELEQKKIELLKEYRQSLISEVVTGKIRVCEEDLSEIN
jgi:type I restriction enzyme, S subunit